MAGSKKSVKEEAKVSLPLIASVEIAPLPGLVVPILVSHKSAIASVKAALEDEEASIVLSLMRGQGNEEPSEENLEKVAGLGKVIQSVELASGELQVRIHIQSRFLIDSFDSFSPHIQVSGREYREDNHIKISTREEKLVKEVKENIVALSEYNPQLEEHSHVVRDVFDPGLLADLVTSILPVQVIDAQQVLEELDRYKRLKIVTELSNKQVDLAAIKERISNRAQKELTDEGHEQLLREQLRQIQQELGEEDEFDTDVEELSLKLERARMPKYAKEEAKKQLRRIQRMHPDTSEAALARTYLEWILAIPWNKRTKDRLDLEKAKKILDEDHFGLEKTKERILDFLSVRKLKKDHRGPVLLFVGPPGVGKTSLGRSIARALGRKFVRVSVGGLRDEAELRGHRRTYVGALPGRIIQGIKTAGTRNPVLMLDELDKIGSDFRGDPASVLLEVLDPEQNKNFEDYYLNIPYDLSEVMFICTANMVDTIPGPLLDRLETIEIAGYTTEEKVQIAKRYLIPRAKEDNGLGDKEIAIRDRGLLHMLDRYTRESGVRELGRVVKTVFRKVARLVAEEKEAPSEIDENLIEEFLGVPKYTPEKMLLTDQVGVATGLAWTSVGGEILTLEVAITKGKGSLSLTGQLGEVMKESGVTALTFILSKAEELGVDPNFYENSNVHIHIPQGAIPKDGPSAGICIATALVSALTGRAVSRNVAMTGEITLTGNVLEIGGLREKALAAMRAGIYVVIIPKANEKELVEFPRYLLDKVTFVAVERIEEVLEIALCEDECATRESKKVEEKKSVVVPRK